MPILIFNEDIHPCRGMYNGASVRLMKYHAKTGTYTVETLDGTIIHDIYGDELFELK